jgi:hypothetical protein
LVFHRELYVKLIKNTYVRLNLSGTKMLSTCGSLLFHYSFFLGV